MLEFLKSVFAKSQQSGSAGSKGNAFGDLDPDMLLEGLGGEAGLVNILPQLPKAVRDAAVQHLQKSRGNSAIAQMVQGQPTAAGPSGQEQLDSPYGTASKTTHLLDSAQVQKAIRYNQKRFSKPNGEPDVSAISTMQERLGIAGSGEFDEPTVQALASMQQGNGLKADGMLGPKSEPLLEGEKSLETNGLSNGNQVEQEALVGEIEDNALLSSPDVKLDQSLDMCVDSEDGYSLITTEQLQSIVEENCCSLESSGSVEKKEEATEKAQEEGLINAELQKQIEAIPDQESEEDQLLQKWIHDPSDVVSMLPKRVGDLYKQCVSLAAKGHLVFPQKTDPPSPKTFKPFERFVSGLINHFTKERRIGFEIQRGKGGKKAWEIKSYIESTLKTIPGERWKGGGQPKLHAKALDAFLKMAEAADKDGVPLIICHGYRVPNRNATTTNSMARATNSPHSYGLAVDILLSVSKGDCKHGKGVRVTETSTKNMSNMMKMYTSSVAKWLLVNGSKFEFYPYRREPWHWEYNPDGMAKEILEGAKNHK